MHWSSIWSGQIQCSVYVGCQIAMMPIWCMHHCKETLSSIINQILIWITLWYSHYWLFTFTTHLICKHLDVISSIRLLCLKFLPSIKNILAHALLVMLMTNCTLFSWSFWVFSCFGCFDMRVNHLSFPLFPRHRPLHLQRCLITICLMSHNIYIICVDIYYSYFEV